MHPIRLEDVRSLQLSFLSSVDSYHSFWKFWILLRSENLIACIRPITTTSTRSSNTESRVARNLRNDIQLDATREGAGAGRSGGSYWTLCSILLSKTIYLSAMISDITKWSEQQTRHQIHQRKNICPWILYNPTRRRLHETSSAAMTQQTSDPFT